MSSYRELSTLPDYVDAIWDEGGKLINADAAVKWSGKIKPPAIGAVIDVNMNGLGRATVKAYFIESGWLGLLCRFHNPPAWYVKQNGSMDQPGHIFGNEFKDVVAP